MRFLVDVFYTGLVVVGLLAQTTVVVLTVWIINDSKRKNLPVIHLEFFLIAFSLMLLRRITGQIEKITSWTEAGLISLMDNQLLPALISICLLVGTLLYIRETHGSRTNQSHW